MKDLSATTSAPQTAPPLKPDIHPDSRHRLLQRVTKASRELTTAINVFGSAYAVYTAYINLGAYRHPDGTLKTYQNHVDDLAGLVGKSTVHRWLKKIDPSLSAALAEAHPIPTRKQN